MASDSPPSAPDVEALVAEAIRRTPAYEAPHAIALSIQNRGDDPRCLGNGVLIRLMANALTATQRAAEKVAELEAQLKAADEAIDVLDAMVANADFRNGNTDQSGSIDEGSVFARRFYMKAAHAIAASKARRQARQTEGA